MPTGIGNEIHWWIPSLDTDGNGTTTLTDFGSSAVDGTLTNMDATTDWVSDTNSGGTYALDFDGSNDYVATGDLSVIDGCTTLSFLMWFYPRAWNHLDFAAEKGSVMLIGRHSSITSSNGGVAFVSSGSWKPVNFSSSPTLDTWHSLIFTISSSTLTVYLDGTLQGSRSDVSAVASSGDDFNIGGRSTSFPFNGRIDDVRIWSRVITSGERANLDSQRAFEPATGIARQLVDGGLVNNGLVSGGLIG